MWKFLHCQRKNEYDQPQEHFFLRLNIQNTCGSEYTYFVKVHLCNYNFYKHYISNAMRYALYNSVVLHNMEFGLVQLLVDCSVLCHLCHSMTQHKKTQKFFSYLISFQKYHIKKFFYNFFAHFWKKPPITMILRKNFK